MNSMNHLRHGGTGGSRDAELEDFGEKYKEIALNCFRYLGMKSLEEVNKLTIPEYNLLMKSVELRRVDEEYRLHLQAFLNFKAKAKKKAGKDKLRPVYANFKKFFDYEKEVNRVLGKNKTDSRFIGIGKLLKKQ